MATGEDWLLRPVLRGLCTWESLVNGSLTLEDVANLNDALDVDDENQRRLQEREKERTR